MIRPHQTTRSSADRVFGRKVLLSSLDRERSLSWTVPGNARKLRFGPGRDRTHHRILQRREIGPAELDWLTISDQSGSLTHDVRRIRPHPLVPGHIRIFGFVYDVAAGRLDEVLAASRAGRPKELIDFRGRHP